jgi:beta-galactosidase
VNDEYGNVRPFASDAIPFEIEGPGVIIGDNPFALVGGTGAIWVRTKEAGGTIRLKGKHPRLGSQTVEFKVTAAAAEVA